jgi:hypothetical protein
MPNDPNRTSLSRSRLSRRAFFGASLGVIPALGFQANRSRHERTGEPALRQPADPPRVKAYRTLGRTAWRVSDISFGAGNLSNAGVLQTALGRGVNYIDTGEHYERGGSERTIGEALKGVDRKSVFVTTKLNLSFDKRIDKAGIRERFQKCLERMRLDYADCLMIHMCTLAQIKYEPYHEAIRELKAEGRVRFLRPPRTAASTSSCSSIIISRPRSAERSWLPARPRPWERP